MISCADLVGFFDGIIINVTHKRLIQKLLDCGVVHKGKITLRSGEKADFYIDLKKAYGEPELLAALVSEMNRLVPKRATCVATIGQGGAPLATLISQKLNLKLSLVRDRQRKHGTKKIIDGYIPSRKDIVVVVDDVFTTGSSVRDIIKRLKPTGCEIISAVVAVKRGENKIDLPLSYIFTLEDLKF